MHDTVLKRYRHLTFFRHDCNLELRTPRVRLPDRCVALVEPGWVGKLGAFTLLRETMALALASRCVLPRWPAPPGASVNAPGPSLSTTPVPLIGAAQVPLTFCWNCVSPLFVTVDG